MGLMKELDGLNAAYASMRESDQPMLLTKADKTGNTPAWRNRHKTSVKTGKPLYKMADHLKDEYEAELWDTVAHNLTELHELGGVKFKVVPLDEKQKDTPDQVKAVIAYDKARKGTKDATYDTEHGDKEQAKKERDYAKWQRDKGAEDAQKSGHPWKHAKYSTREKEGKKSVKHAHIKDSYNSIYREDAQSDAVAQMSGAGGDPQDDAMKQLVDAEKKRSKKKGGAHAEMSRTRKRMASQKEDKDWGYDKKGNSLNPVDQMKKKRKDDDLAGAPNKVKEALASSGKFTVEEIAKIAGIEIDEAQTAYEKARKAAARRAADRNAARRRGEMGGRMERETYTNEAGKRMHYKGYTARDGE